MTQDQIVFNFRFAGRMLRLHDGYILGRNSPLSARREGVVLPYHFSERLSR